MKESHIYQHIIFEISDAESEKHLKKCPSCNTIKSSVDDVMSLLDTEVKIPEGLADSIMKKKKSLAPHKVHKFNLTSYLQVSLIIVSGILLGIILGKNANTSLIHSDQNQFHKSLIELREIYHLNVKEPPYLL